MMKAVHLCVMVRFCLNCGECWKENILINILNSSFIIIIAAVAGLAVNSHLGVNSSLNSSDGMKIK